jgi:hypothetical protein
MKFLVEVQLNSLHRASVYKTMFWNYGIKCANETLRGLLEFGLDLSPCTNTNSEIHLTHVGMTKGVTKVWSHIAS